MSSKKEKIMKKTSDAQLEATAKYKKKVYQRFILSLRKIEDEDILSALNELFEQGYTTTEAFKILIRKGL